MRNGKVVLIYSGGMDSTVALYKLCADYGASNVKAISFDYQSKHNDEEYKRASASTKFLGVEHSRIDLSSIAAHLESDLLKSGGEIPEGHYAESNMKKTVVPFRNGIMLSIAIGIAESWGAGEVAIGNHAGDHAIYPDCRATFISAMNEAGAYGTYLNVNIISPFQRMTKSDIAHLGSRLAVDFTRTYSCYVGNTIHCGKCGTCVERRMAFYEAGVQDPTEYSDGRTEEQFYKDFQKMEKKLRASGEIE